MSLHLLALTLVGCSNDCPTFAELEVTDPGGVAPDGALERVRAAVDEFALWTGRDGVCVGEVRIVEELEVDGDPAGGNFDGPRRLVNLTVPKTSAETVRHELCHALDTAEDLSWPNRALFPGGAENGDRRGATFRQAFADSCEPGPAALAITAVLPDCVVSDAQGRFLAEEVWSAWDPGFQAAPLGMERRELTGMPVDGSRPAGHPIAGPDGLYVTFEARGGALSFVRVDVATASVVDRIPGPTPAPFSDWSLHGSEGEDPLLLVTDGTTTHAWRLRDGGLVEAPFPEELTNIRDGVLADGAVWLQSSSGGFARVDLATLEVSEVPLPDAPGGPDLRFARVGDRRIAMPWSTGSGWQLATLSVPGLAWTLHDLPAPLIPVTARPLEDGRVVFGWLTEEADVHASGLGWFDPVSGDWSLDEESCGAHRLNFPSDVLQLGGRAWAFEWPDPEDMHDTHGLVSMELPGR